MTQRSAQGVTLLGERAATFPVEWRPLGTVLRRCEACSALVCISPASLASAEKQAAGGEIRFRCRPCLPKEDVEILEFTEEQMAEAEMPAGTAPEATAFAARLLGVKHRRRDS